MQSVQRKFGKLMKRSADGADVGGILREFNNTDQALASFIEHTKSWRNAWDETLKTQLFVAQTMHVLYKPIEVEQDADTPAHHKPAATPRRYLDKASDLESVYASLDKDLSNEINLIEAKILRPAMDAKDSLKMLKKPIKRREDLKLDYERYTSRADSVRRKETRSAREENALMKHENDLARSSADYRAADEQLTRVLPPVLDALASLLPDLLATQIMIQYQLVGQLYTQLHEYCQAHQLPSPAPAMELVMSAFEAEYTRIREDLERNIKTVAEGKAVHQPMSIPDKQHGTVTGLGLRNNFARRTSSQGSMPRPTVPGQLRIGGAASEDEVDTTAVRPRRPGRISSNSRLHSHYEKTATKQSHYEDEEAPPVKPPRPGAAPMIDATGKPRISSSSKVAGLSAGEGYSTASSTPSSSSTPLTLRQGCDYFSQEGRASAGSGSYGVAGKKKPPPPPPKKRALSSQGQYVTALYDYAGQGEGDLSFAEGDRIKVVKKTASIDDWWEGELNGVGGSFPANYVKVD